MPLLTVTHPKGQRGTGQGERVDWALGCKWMEEVHGGEEGQPAERSRKRQR